MDYDASLSLCKGKPTEWWFPENTAMSIKNSKTAIRICQECPNRIPCLNYALRNETHGIWGGMREVERELYRRDKNIQLSERAQTNMSASARRVRRLDKQNKLETL